MKHKLGFSREGKESKATVIAVGVFAKSFANVNGA
jgi:hypothetical protein